MAPEPLDRLPHRDPFRFISTVTSLDPGAKGEALWSLRGDEDFFKGHFPGEPIVPGVLIAEALAQLSGIVGLHSETAQGGRLVHVDVRFDAPVKPPAELVLRSSLSRSLGPLRQFDVSALCGGRAVARGTLALAAIDQQSGA